MGPLIRWSPEEEALVVNLALTERTHVAPHSSVTQDWHDLTELLFNQPEMLEYRAACFVKFDPASTEERQKIRARFVSKRTQLYEDVHQILMDIEDIAESKDVKEKLKEALGQVAAGLLPPAVSGMNLDGTVSGANSLAREKSKGAGSEEKQFNKKLLASLF
ncbi:hypothetical protein B484DRAFT_400119 [Ochromonadaceae sp. CCMP2298]|nr:hypothetical protein B484DRAFT_400119 [Ochromonadaceae sp. CCMP2298]